MIRGFDVARFSLINLPFSQERPRAAVERLSGGHADAAAV